MSSCDHGRVDLLVAHLCLLLLINLCKVLSERSRDEARALHKGTDLIWHFLEDFLSKIATCHALGEFNELDDIA